MCACLLERLPIASATGTRERRNEASTCVCFALIRGEPMLDVLVCSCAPEESSTFWKKKNGTSATPRHSPSCGERRYFHFRFDFEPFRMSARYDRNKSLHSIEMWFERIISGGHFYALYLFHRWQMWVIYSLGLTCNNKKKHEINLRFSKGL